MADNTQLDIGSGGDVIATDDISGVKHQRVKVEFGADGSATDVSALNRLPVETVYKDGPNLDAFGRLRAAAPYTIFDSKQLYDIEPLIWVNSTSGTASETFSSNTASTQLAVGNASGDEIIRQTKKYMDYQPGKSILIMITGHMDTPKSNNTQRIGYFDDNNGLFFEHDGSNLKVVRRTKTSGSVVDNAINQSAWNLDKLDGTGDSGFTIDVTKTNIFIIDFQWLGVGRVRFGFVIDGKLVYVHQILNANNLTEVYMSTPNLPVRFHNVNTGATSGTTTMKHICSTVISEGGYDPLGITRSVDRGISGSVITTTLEPLISIRLKSAYNRVNITKLKSSVMTSTNANFRYVISLNPTITGGTAASWTSVTNSAVEYDISQDGTVSNEGTVLSSGYVANSVEQLSVDLESAVGLAADISGTSDIITLSVQTISGSNTFFGSFGWKELY